MAENKTTILNDKAIESLKDDALDFIPYVQALADICMTGSTPLTIGVFGTWGSGKTSLMRMVKEQVEASGAVAGWFDAWKYDKDETLWRAFLLSVLSAVRTSTKEGQPTDDLDYLETMLYRAIDLEKSGGVTIDLAKLGGKLAQGAVQIGLSFIPGGAALGKIIEELQKAGTDNITEGALDAIQRERSKIHIEQVRFLEQFQDKFRTLVQQHIVNNGGRLVVFVDDIDRCLPEKAIEVLETIKLFVDAPGCVFVLGLDQEVIARGIELKYREIGIKDSENRLPIDGIRYLEKIIQLPFQLPPVEREDMNDFVHGLMTKWPHLECPRVFAEGLGNNPRQIKRTVNVFLMLWQLAERRKAKLQGQIKPIRLAKVVVIQAIYPELYNLLKETPRYLRDLEENYQIEAKEQRIQNLFVKIPPQDILNLIDTEIEKRPKGESSKNSQGAEPSRKPVLPPALTSLVGNQAVRQILTLHPPEMEDANFINLKPDELRIYFTLTKRVETPLVVVEPFIEPQMVKIPASKFLMGSTNEQAELIIKQGLDKDYLEFELPQHEVELSEYYIGKYPVTNREYQVFIKDTGYKSPLGWSGDNYPGEKGDHPVTYVSWDDALAYCAWLKEKTSKSFQLPTEAEWEKASRGPDGRMYPWGNDADSKKCNIRIVKNNKTSSVGQFSPQGDSPYGCADMIGNVWEWCQDWFDPDEYKARAMLTIKDPLGPQKGLYRILRGGSFNYSLNSARCANRFKEFPYRSYEDGGFRVAYQVEKLPSI